MPDSISIISSYRTGCYPGRLQARSYEMSFSSIQNDFPNVRGYVALMGNDCNSWGNNYLTYGSNLTLLKDEDEHIFRGLFQTHPSYGILYNNSLVYKSEVFDATQIRQAVQSISDSMLEETSVTYSPPLPPPVESKTEIHFYNLKLLHRTGIDKFYCKHVVDIAMNSKKEIHLACQESQCVYKIDSHGKAYCLQDRAFYHYNAHMSSIDITNDMLVTCQDSQNDYGGTKSPNMFMGLTLYDLTLPFIRTNGENYDSSDSTQIPYLIHVDMLHEAPNCTGVVSANKKHEDNKLINRYLHVDNLNSQLVVTDFETPHGPGSMDHSTANVERLYGIPLSENLGGVAIDAEREVGYVADTGFNRIIEIYYTSGKVETSARYDFPIFSSIDESFVYSIRDEISWKNVANFSQPTKLALRNHTLYAINSDSIIAIDTLTYSKTMIMNIENATGMRIFDDFLYVTFEQSFSVYSFHNTIEPPMSSLEVQKTVGVTCSHDNECLSAHCDQFCQPNILKSYKRNTPNAIQSYINSEEYNRSFVAQHILTGGFGSYANYQNLYPVMQPDFCSTVGNQSGSPDCELIDFDSLLLGACWGHPCLPNHLHCLNEGIVKYISFSGYRCECNHKFEGDKCQSLKKNRQMTLSRHELRSLYTHNNCCEQQCSASFSC